METYISFLRGINVSGSKMIKMEKLKELYLTLQFSQVRTYIQSGNVIFNSGETDIKSNEQLITDAIKVTFGFDVPVLVLKQKALHEILQNNPFLLMNQDVNTRFLYVTLLKELPLPETIEKLMAVDFSPEKIVLFNQAVYLYLPDGYGNARFNNNFIETRLQTQATTRNWKTLNALAGLAG